MTSQKKTGKLLFCGNEAVGEAAIQAGCLCYFGYPITPQNELTAYMALRMEQEGRVFIQSESELAAINMVFGASLTGTRAMTSSSSPGISLKQEGLSYLAGCELPAVFVNMMRGGPGLGNIGPGQADYFQSTRGGGHGDYRTPKDHTYAYLLDEFGVEYDSLADIIAYVNHDIDDAIRARVITRDQIPATCRRLLGERHSQRINTMVTDIIDSSCRAGGERLLISPEILEAITQLREFLYRQVYDSEIVHADFIKATRLLEDLYHFFIDNPHTFREQYHHAYLDSASLEQNVCDFIAGMTDRYAFSLYEQIFLPQPWLIK